MTRTGPRPSLAQGIKGATLVKGQTHLSETALSYESAEEARKGRPVRQGKGVTRGEVNGVRGSQWLRTQDGQGQLGEVRDWGVV